MQDLKCNRKEYVTSVLCNNHLVNVFLDDYGQQYYFQFVDNNGVVQTRTCGTYESNYMDQIEYELDYNSWFEKQPDWYKEMSKEGRSRTIKWMMEEPEHFSDEEKAEYGVNPDGSLMEHTKIFMSIAQGLHEAIDSEKENK